MIRIGKGKLLELTVFILADFRADALSADGCKSGASRSQHHGNNRTARHQQAFFKNIGLIRVGNSHIHHIRHDEGNNQLQKGLQNNTEHCQNRCRPVFLHVRK